MTRWVVDHVWRQDIGRMHFITFAIGDPTRRRPPSQTSAALECSPMQWREWWP